MKTSGKIVLVTVSMVLLLTTAGIIAFGVIVTDNNSFSSAIVRENEESAVREYDLEDFSAVSAGGAWDLDIVHGDSLRVNVTAPRSIIDHVVPEVAGGTLHFDQVFTADPRRMNLKARITMPVLTGIEASGNSGVRVSGFNLGGLTIKATDACQVIGNDLRIGELVCSVVRAAKVDLSASSVVNARLDTGWAGSVTLRMAGGALTGKAGGSSTVSFSGDVGEIDFETSGSVKFRKTRL